MKRFIFILAMLFLLLSCKKSEAQLDFVTEYWLAQNFTPKSGITPGTNNTSWMDCDQVLARYQVTISGVTSTGNRLPSESQITSNIEYVTCGESILKDTYKVGTTTYTYDVDFGVYNGLRVYNYQNYSDPDKIDIYQNNILRASTGYLVDYGSFVSVHPGDLNVVKSLPLYFKYDVSNGRYGKVKITTDSSHKDWKYYFDCNSLCNLNSTYSHVSKNYVYSYELNYGGNYTLVVSQTGEVRDLGYSILRDNSVVALGTITSNPGYVLVDLQYGGNYYICFKSLNGSYASYNSNTTSITLYGCGSKPSTSITSIFNITPTTANITYTVDSDCTISRAICYSSTNTNPTTSDSHTTYTTETGSSTVQLSGLSPSTTYYLRSVAANVNRTTYSTATSFTTAAEQPYTGVIDLSAYREEDPQYYDVTFTATAQTAVQMNTIVYLAYTDPAGGSIYNTVVIPTGSTSVSVIVRYYRNTQYDVSCDFDSSYSVDFTYGTHPVYVTIPSL